MFDVIIPVSNKHIEQVLVNLDFIFRNLPAKKIKIICKKSLFDLFPINNPKIELLDEDTTFNFNYTTIEKVIKSRGADTIKSGWYLQQFFKMEYCFL